MLNVYELERKWLRYKIKSFIPKILLSLFIIIVIITITTYTLDSDNTKDTKLTKTDSNVLIHQKDIALIENVHQKKSPATPQTADKQTKIEKETKKHSKVTLIPSLSFINTIKNMPKEEDAPTVKEEKISINTPKEEYKLKKPVKDKIEKKTEIIEEPIILTEEKVPESKVFINIQEKEADINDVIKRFKANKSPALSLFIAKRYYALGRYKEAYNYALITNEIDSENEDSWLIAAKSLNNIDEKDKAIDLLNKFISKSHSIKAQMILQQIKEGTL